jgi:hypothetical protein
MTKNMKNIEHTDPVELHHWIRGAVAVHDWYILESFGELELTGCR